MRSFGRNESIGVNGKGDYQNSVDDVEVDEIFFSDSGGDSSFISEEDSSCCSISRGFDEDGIQKLRSEKWYDAIFLGHYPRRVFVLDRVHYESQPIIVSGGSDNFVHIWSVPSGECIWSLGPGEDSVSIAKFSPSGEHLFVAHLGGNVRICTNVLKDCKIHNDKICSDEIYWVSWISSSASSSATSVIFGADDGVYRVNVTSEEIGPLECLVGGFGGFGGILNDVYTISFDFRKGLSVTGFKLPHGEYDFCINNSDAKDRSAAYSDNDSCNQITCSAFSEEYYLAVCDLKAIYVISLKARKIIKTLEAPLSATCATFSKNSQIIAVGCQDGTILQYETKNYTLTSTKCQNSPITALCFYQSRLIIAGHKNGCILYLDALNPSKKNIRETCLGQINDIKTDEQVRYAAFATDNGVALVVGEHKFFNPND